MIGMSYPIRSDLEAALSTGVSCCFGRSYEIVGGTRLELVTSTV
jgi:hypothetical protein